MNKKGDELAAVECNGGIYVVGGYLEGSCLNCMERIDANDLLQSSSTSCLQKIHWVTLNCRLSTGEEHVVLFRLSTDTSLYWVATTIVFVVG